MTRHPRDLERSFVRTGRVARLLLVAGAGAVGLTLGGCGARAADAAADVGDDGELVSFLESVRGAVPGQRATDAAREDGGEGGQAEGFGGPTLVVDRPAAFARGQSGPPVDERPLDDLAPEEVLLSFTLLAEDGRFADQWPLLSAATQDAWVARMRSEARRVGRAAVERQVASGDGRALWQDAFDGSDVRVDLDVAWRTQVGRDRAEVSVLRGHHPVDSVRLVREDGGWRLDLTDRISEPTGSTTRR